MKTIMILGGSLLQLPAIIKAKEMGLNVVVCDYYEDCPGKRVEGVIGELISHTILTEFLRLPKSTKLTQ